jgi:hypothetical protein
MGKIANGDGRHLPLATEGTSYTRYIENQFALTAHRCDTDARCQKLGCDKSYVWKEGGVPPLESVDTLLDEWSAYLSHDGNPGSPSGTARKRLKTHHRRLNKQKLLHDAFLLIAGKATPWRDLTILCDWEPTHLARIYDEVTTLIGSTVVATKTLHFLNPDLFVILDRKQSYPTLRDEIRIERQTELPEPDHIDLVNGAQYVQLMAYVHDEVKALIAQERSVRLKNGTRRTIIGVSDFRWLSPRKGENGRATPGTICKVVDNFFPTPRK